MRDHSSDEFPGAGVFDSPWPLHLAVLTALFTDLDRQGIVAWDGSRLVIKCDHTLSKSEAFLRGHVSDPAAALRWLQEHGAGCDCEVLLNVTSRYEDAFGQEDDDRE